MHVYVGIYVGKVRDVRHMADMQTQRDGEGELDIVTFQAQVSVHEAKEKAGIILARSFGVAASQQINEKGRSVLLLPDF